MKYVRINLNGGLERLSLPDDATISSVTDTYTTYYNGQSHNNPVYSIEIKQGDNVLARMGGVAMFRDEVIGVEKLKMQDGEAIWEAEP